MRVPGLRGLRPWTLAVETYRAFDQHDMWTYAAAVAFSVLFALFPFLLLLLALFGFLDQPGLFESLLAQSHRVLPADAHAQVREVVDEVRGQRDGGLLSLGVLSTLWIASGGVRSVMNALNTAYDVPEGRVWWKRYTWFRSATRWKRSGGAGDGADGGGPADQHPGPGPVGGGTDEAGTA